MRAEPYFSGKSHSAVSKMAGSRHTLTCCLSEVRSSLEAGKKQPRVWLEYSCDVPEVLLYPSFGALLGVLWPPYSDLVSAYCRHGYFIKECIGISNKPPRIYANWSLIFT